MVGFRDLVGTGIAPVKKKLLLKAISNETDESFLQLTRSVSLTIWSTKLNDSQLQSFGLIKEIIC
jgi:hypothetical protein